MTPHLWLPVHLQVMVKPLAFASVLGGNGSVHQVFASALPPLQLCHHSMTDRPVNPSCVHAWHTADELQHCQPACLLYNLVCIEDSGMHTQMLAWFECVGCLLLHQVMKPY